jgi:Fe-S-cluster containining protein
MAETSTWDCQSCGACCAHDPAWPRFSLESDEDIARLPDAMVAADGSGMRWTGTRCAALSGHVGRAVTCTVYEARPIVCRDCQPGDEACRTARAARGLEA